MRDEEGRRKIRLPKRIKGQQGTLSSKKDLDWCTAKISSCLDECDRANLRERQLFVNVDDGG